MVLIRDHHTGYITWEQFERNQVMLTDNAHMKSRMEPKAARGGRSLLAGLLRCRRCGRMLHVAYSGSHGEVPRYHCRGAHHNHGGDWCISFGGLRPDRAIASEILKAVEGNAIEAALEVAARVAEQQRQRHDVLSLELEQARYEVSPGREFARSDSRLLGRRGAALRGVAHQGEPITLRDYCSRTLRNSLLRSLRSTNEDADLCERRAVRTLARETERYRTTRIDDSTLARPDRGQVHSGARAGLRQRYLKALEHSALLRFWT